MKLEIEIITVVDRIIKIIGEHPISILFCSEYNTLILNFSGGTQYSNTQRPYHRGRYGFRESRKID